MANYAVVRTDNMAGTDVRAQLVSIKYMGVDGKTPTAIENGNVLKCGALINGEREIHVGAACAANTPLNEVVLVATPEVLYCNCNGTGLHNYINESETICRGYRIHSGDHFSVTKEALTGKATPAVGDIVELAAGTKLKVAASATSGSTVVGKVEAVERAGIYTFYVIAVD